MSNAINTKRRSFQFNGPHDSSDYNARIEENYRDLIVLYNKVEQLSETGNNYLVNTVKNLMGITRKIDEVEKAVEDLMGNSSESAISLTGNGYTVDVDRFDGTQFEISPVDRLVDNGHYPGLFLPPSSGGAPFRSSITLGNEGFVPDSVESRVVGVSTSLDSPGAIVDGTRPEFSFARFNGPAWERNVVTSNTSPEGAVADVYISIPQDVALSNYCNYICLDPYPSYSVDVLSVEYTESDHVTLSPSDGYRPINFRGLYTGDPGMVGFNPPGGWAGDEINRSGRNLWIFEPVNATAIKVRIRQRDYYTEGGNYVYTYGANHIDVGVIKTLTEGRTILRVDAAPGSTVSYISDIVPEIWNLSRAYHSEVFSYRVIWETELDSGIYTTTPVPLSNRAWVEVTLKKASNETIPMLSGLSFNIE